MPILPDTTPRLWVAYTSYGIKHEMMFRFADSVTASEASSAAQTICQGLAPLMNGTDDFNAARYAAGGSNVSLPAPWGVIAGTGQNAVVPGDARSRYLTFVGRGTASGGKVRWRFFTCSQSVPLPAHNRFEPGDNALVDSAVALMVGAATPGTAEYPLVTVHADSPAVYHYVNSGFDAYWQREQRKGA